MRLVIVLVAVGGLGLAGWGCGKDCKSACSKLYSECKLFITTAGGGRIEEPQCVSDCNTFVNKDAIVSCIHNTPCADTGKMEACVQQAQTGPGPTGDDCSKACATVYGTCGLVLQSNTVDLTQQECVAACGKLANKAQVNTCVNGAGCEPNTIVGCFQ